MCEKAVYVNMFGNTSVYDLFKLNLCDTIDEISRSLYVVCCETRNCGLYFSPLSSVRQAIQWAEGSVVAERGEGERSGRRIAFQEL